MYLLHSSSNPGQFRQFFSRPVSGDIVVCEQCLEEMVCVAFISILEAEVINDEDKDQWMPVVVPEAGRDGALLVSMFCESRGEKVVGQFT
jgi:hypothetical protein